jgi:D-glycero-alpha-D-manno-heptose-7-phosphate kinase
MDDGRLRTRGAVANPLLSRADHRADNVIISKTPLRVSFVGGGTDIPDFYEEHGGAVVSSAIDKWIHVVVAPRFEGDLRVSYSRTEIVSTVSDVQHELVREALRMTGLPRGLDVVTLADVPSQGTGLGSSSAVTVGLLNALYAYQGIFRSTTTLAEEACHIEIDVLGKPIGRQDQYASALGGFNFIEFMPRGGGVRVEPIVCPPQTLEQLHRSLMLFYTGRQRTASDVLGEQREAIIHGTVTEKLAEMRDLSHEMREVLGRGDVTGVGSLLHRNWELKRSLVAGVSDTQLDIWYERARHAGASGGKLLGAGAGGFLLIMAPPERQTTVRAALADMREVPFHFAARGTEITLLDRTV